MAVKRMQDLLDYVKQCHHQLSELFHRLKSETDKYRIRAMLTYLERHEAELETSLQKYEDEASERILQTWFQVAPEPHLIEEIEAVHLADDMTTDDVVTIALRLDDQIVELYRNMIECSETDEVRAVFQDLHDMETRQEMQVARNAAMLSGDL